MTSSARAFCATTQRPHGIWQLAQRKCPATFVSNPASGQLQLHPITENGTSVLSFAVPGTARPSSSARWIRDLGIACLPSRVRGRGLVQPVGALCRSKKALES